MSEAPYSKTIGFQWISIKASLIDGYYPNLYDLSPTFKKLCHVPDFCGKNLLYLMGLPLYVRKGRKSGKRVNASKWDSTEFSVKSTIYPEAFSAEILFQRELAQLNMPPVFNDSARFPLFVRDRLTSLTVATTRYSTITIITLIETKVLAK